MFRSTVPSKHSSISLPSGSFPCFHKLETPESHNLGTSSENPVLRTLIDLAYTQAHNQSILFDRFQWFAKTTTSRLERLESLVTSLQGNQVQTSLAVLDLAEAAKEIEKPKPVEQEAVNLVKELEERLKEVKAALEHLELLQQS